MIRAFCFGLAAASALAASPALAQDDEEPPRILSIGGGGQLLPKYPGADDYGLGPLVTGFVRREGAPIPFRTPDDGFGIGLLGRDSVVDFGPLLQFQSERDEDDVGAAVGDVDFTVEAGAFVNINISPAFRIRLEGQKGLGGHDGLVGTVAADFALRGGNDTLFTIGPRLRLNDDDYAQAYFGVTPAVAAATGLPVYDPDGGIRAVGAVAGITHQLSRSFGIYGYAGYDRLVGDAADSPIVRNFGSRDQFSAGVALFVSFSIGNPF
ncbi:MipA/OmpV family protein [Sphingosinicella sp. YJ22]|uniref:MipA/OmpV family protein n=1 Tax=Sphingosinicella sp. YJ22 TaxID=1104780 RepID=UPI00140A586B|nr:MipA/OmpV family protein [Sphingosinicella sp. YJ22]